MQNSIPESPRAHILLVEKNRGALAFLETMLCWKGYQVTIAADGLDGLEKFRLGQFNLIFTNLSTPRISGWELGRSYSQKQSVFSACGPDYRSGFRHQTRPFSFRCHHRRASPL